MLLLLTPSVYNGITNFGYGFFDEIPLIYVLKYLTPAKLIVFLGGTLTYFPFDKLIQSISLNLTDVHSNTEVTRIKRFGGDKWGIFTSKPSKSKNPSSEKSTEASSSGNMLYKCNNVVLAFPPTEEALSMIEELDQATIDLLANIKTVAYWEATIQGLSPCDKASNQTCLASRITYGKIPPAPSISAPSFDIPNYYYRRTKESVVLSLFNGGTEDNLNQNDVLNVTRGHLNDAFGYDPATYTIDVYQKHQYFPHVSSDAMKAGFYSALEDIQGNQGLYFTGGFRDFELVELAMRTTEDLLHHHFPAKNA